MSNNVEKFVVSLGFKDSDIAKLKSILKIQSTSQKQAKQQQDGLNKKKSDELSIDRKRLQMEKLIQRAKKENIDTSYYERSLRSSKKIETIERNRLKLEREILKTKEKQSKLAKSLSSDVRPEIQGPSKEMFLANQRAIREKAARDNDILRQDNAMRSVKLAAMKMGFDESRVKFFTEQAKGAYRSREAMRALTLQMQEAAFKNRDLNKQLAKQNMLMRGLNDSSRNLVRSYVSVFAVLGATTSINRVGQSFESMNSSMLTATGNVELAAKEVEFLQNMTRRLGTSMIDTSDSYSKFLFASRGKLDTSQTRELFEGLSELGTTLGISKERMKLSMNAITQMLNKGKISSEELRLI